MKRKIFITGGHLTPAVAVVNKILEKENQWEIYFVGRKYAFEADKALSNEFSLFEKYDDVKFLSITTGRIQSRITRKFFLSLLKIPFGFIQSFWWLIRYRPHVVLSFGGYVAVPVALAAWLLDIPVVTHEQTITVGRANRFIELLSKKIFVSWQSSLPEVDKEKAVLTGNPIRDETFVVKKTPLFLEYQQSMKKNSRSTKTIWVTGGNMGSHSINELVKSALPELLKKYFIIHQTGRSDEYRDKVDLENFVKQLSPKLSHNYLVQEYIGPDDIGWVLKNSDVIVGRSGANTITDLLALTKPAILIPLPWAGRNEQYLNAKFYESLGGGIILEQKDATPKKLINMLAEVCQHLDHYEQPLKEASKKLIPDPAEKIVSEIIKLID